MKVDPTVEGRQKSILEEVRKKRDESQVTKRLKVLEETAKGSGNLMPALLDCARAYCTIGEISAVLRCVFGEYHDPGYV